MKKFLLTLGLFCVCGNGVLFAQPASNNPNVIEDTLQVNALWDAGGYAPANVNAYSRSNMDINAVNSDLYVFSWDRGVTVTPAYDIYTGMAVRQYIAGTPVNAAATPIASAWINETNAGYPSRYVSSLEPGILKRGDSTIIALTFFSGDFNPTTGIFSGDFFLNLYLWNYSGSNTLTLYQTIDLTHSGDAFPQGWIHQDVNNADSMVITWEEDGQIETKAGVMTATGLQLGNTAALDAPPGTKPDVAMMRNAAGSLDLYYVFNDQSNQHLNVFQGDFSTLYNLAGTSLPVSYLYDRTAMGTFGLPRIDAPDHAQYAGQENVWSCVVRDHIPNYDFIFAATSSNLTGITAKFLNDGSLPGLPDITSSTSSGGIANFSCRPTVAFSNQDLNIFYAWTFRNPVWYPNNSLLPAYVSYLSVKATGVLNPMNSPGYQYFVIPYYTYLNGYENEYPSVALSTENDASSRLFSAFTEGTYQHPLTPYFGFKTIDWGSNDGFKPGGNTGIGETSDDGIFSVAPNPFHNSFQIQLNAKEGETFHLTLYNILGQEVYADKGTLLHINKDLLNAEEDLSPGTCFLELKSSAGKVYRKELVKW